MTSTWGSARSARRRPSREPPGGSRRARRRRPRRGAGLDSRDAGARRRARPAAACGGLGAEGLDDLRTRSVRTRTGGGDVEAGAAIAAGPAANILLALVLFTGLFMTSAGKATTTVKAVTARSPAATAACNQGIDRLDRRRCVQSSDISPVISGSHGRKLTVVVVREGARVTLPPASAELRDGVYRLGFMLAGEGLPPLPAAGESFTLTGQVTRDIGASLGASSRAPGATRSRARSASSRAPPTRRSRARRASCSCSASSRSRSPCSTSSRCFRSTAATSSSRSPRGARTGCSPGDLRACLGDRDRPCAPTVRDRAVERHRPPLLTKSS